MNAAIDIASEIKSKKILKMWWKELIEKKLREETLINFTYTIFTKCTVWHGTVPVSTSMLLKILIFFWETDHHTKFMNYTYNVFRTYIFWFSSIDFWAVQNSQLKFMYVEKKMHQKLIKKNSCWYRLGLLSNKIILKYALLIQNSMTLLCWYKSLGR